MGFPHNSPHASPYYEGIAISSLGQFFTDVALGSQPFMIDWSAGDEALAYAPVPFTRTQADQSDRPGEQSVNPEGFWRRSGDSWHQGAGQPDYDRPDSLEWQYGDSLNVNPWEKWQFSLLNDTEQRVASGNNNLHLAVAGERLYYMDGGALRYFTTLQPAGASLETTRVNSGLSTPDVSQFYDADGFRVTFHIRLDDWTPSGLGYILGGQWEFGNSDNGWFVAITPTGNLLVVVSDDGVASTESLQSSVATGFVDGTDHWFRITFDSDNGAANCQADFETSTDGVAWSPLGTAVTGTGTIVPFDSPHPLKIGINSTGPEGNTRDFIYEVGNPGTQVVVSSIDFTNKSPGATKLLDAQGNIWTLDNASIESDAVTPTTVTGHPANAGRDITSNGYYVWTAHGSNGVYRTNRTIGGMSSNITGTVSLIGFVRNRLLAAEGNLLYDVTAQAFAGGALPTPLFNHPNPDFVWTSFADLNGFIYAAGFSGDKSEIFSIAIEDEGTGLSAPRSAGRLPDGEIVRHIDGYTGQFLLIGIDNGWRFAINNEGGDLRIGKLVPTEHPVLCSEGDAEFIYFGIGNFAPDHSGLGRLSTGIFTDLDNLVPAYASDLMAKGANANTLSVVTFEGKRVFSITGVGIFTEVDYLSAFGRLDTGDISFNMTEAKTGVWFDVQHDSAPGAIEVYTSLDDESYVLLARYEQTLPASTTLSSDLGVANAFRFQFRVGLYRDAFDPSSGITVKSWLFRVQPTSEPTDYIYATVLIAPVVDDLNDSAMPMDTYSVLDYLRRLRRDRPAVAWQQKRRGYTVFLEDFRLNHRSLMIEDQGMLGYNGSALLKMKVVL